MHQVKIRRIGSSYGVILPKDLLAQLNVSEGDVLHVSDATDGTVEMSVYDPDFEEAMSSVDDIMKRYRNTLRALAK